MVQESTRFAKANVPNEMLVQAIDAAEHCVGGMVNSRGRGLEDGHHVCRELQHQVRDGVVSPRPQQRKWGADKEGSGGGGG